ncbi:ATP-binding cassette domain-containing protein [Mucilaginibacter phyllosphaerae]|uniref:ABC-type multidrug transport system ATPase subunit n=1 Tax=Mucilaginibacter phyllosphaerae TaxID=1812349 RepID=A0A4Y8AD15_9SPHI|nr:ATP-binding cassette domain-containing protein [Mucilaginibacter phyllosphaerae]MBB3969272.1 ABC-type multidrug transport system ATPase subunit [Mucilaginibacter phyllosphaerae]TEW65929.1 ATP-binding cassette domain-containing protein [Mucilaginibacter phyllosphaerae]GGH07349.1 ABC transporter ATP-binding protein [Mucilaginibacter phyllosphaerae]
MDLLTLKADSIQLEFGGRKILQDVHLSCKQGEVIGLLGRNGCGKSSLLKILFGILKAGYKHVSINGQFIYKGYRDNPMAYLPQHNYLPDNIVIKKLARQIVDPASWNEFTELPAYQRSYDKFVNELSGGELRQLETMMIIHSKADFILLDEPFTHISPIQADEFKSVIRACAKRKGIIITDHQYYNILEVSDKVILLNNGCTKHITNNDKLITYGYLSGR